MGTISGSDDVWETACGKLHKIDTRFYVRTSELLNIALDAYFRSRAQRRQFFFNKAWVDAVWKTRGLYLSVTYTYNFVGYEKPLRFQETVALEFIENNHVKNVNNLSLRLHPVKPPPHKRTYG
jgi:hypothetical protein